MVCITSKLKIFNSVIKLVTINMMDYFFTKVFKLSSNMLLHYKSVFSRVFSSSTLLKSIKNIPVSINHYESTLVVRILSSTNITRTTFYRAINIRLTCKSVKHFMTLYTLAIWNSFSSKAYTNTLIRTIGNIGSYSASSKFLPTYWTFEFKHDMSIHT